MAWQLPRRKSSAIIANKYIPKKNLKHQTKTAHGENVKVSFVSITSSDIRELFGPPEKNREVTRK